jgi:hypothetical protein
MMTMSLPWFYTVPIWLDALIILGFLFICLEASYRIGLAKNRQGKGGEAERRDSVVLSAMLGMLALILAFTYSFTVSRSDKRKAAVLWEINAIGTAFARADLLDEPHRGNIRSVLLDYTRTLPIGYNGPIRTNEIARTVEVMTQAQALIWPATRKMVADSQPPGPLEISVVQSINDVLDAWNARFQAAMDRLPTAIHLMLLFVVGASLSVAGFSAGRTDSLRRWRASALILVLFGIMITIMDFDRPRSGFVRTGHQGYFLLIAEMEVALTSDSVQ